MALRTFNNNNNNTFKECERGPQSIRPVGLVAGCGLADRPQISACCVACLLRAGLEHFGRAARLIGDWEA